MGVGPDKVGEQRLYRGLDALLPHKDGLFRHFQQVYGELFGTTDDLLLYDITSTYFEGQGADNPQAKRGDSRDSRPDCAQVCIALVVTPEGLPLADEVFDGNRAAWMRFCCARPGCASAARRREHGGRDHRGHAREVRPGAAHLGHGPGDG